MRAVARQRVDVRRGEVGVAVDAEVAPALVVGQDDDDVGSAGGLLAAQERRRAQAGGGPENVAARERAGAGLSVSFGVHTEAPVYRGLLRRGEARR